MLSRLSTFTISRWGSARCQSTAVTVNPFSQQTRRFVGGNKWAEREHGLEEATVRKHEQELLDKLKKAEQAKSEAEVSSKQAEERAKVAEDKVKNYSFKATASTPEGNVSMEEYLSFRKEIIDRIRDLEDDIHELRVAHLKLKK